MEQTYLILKEYFRINYYPLELVNIITIYYLDICSHYQVSISDHTRTSLILTPSNELHYWDYAGRHKKIELSNVRKLICGQHCAFAITNSNELYSWGLNTHGQLGLGIPTGTLSDEAKVELSCVKDVLYGFDGIVVALTTDGNVYCWGRINRVIVHKPHKLNISNVKSIFCEWNYVLMITKLEKVYSYIDDNLVKIKFPDKVKIKDIYVDKYDDLVIAMTFSGEVYSWTVRGQHSAKNSSLDNVSKVIHSGYDSPIAVIINSETYLCENDFSQLTKIKIPKVKDAIQYLDLFIALSCDGQIYSRSTDKELPIILLSNVRKIIRGQTCAYAITYRNELYSWGLGGYAQFQPPHDSGVNSPQKMLIENVKDIYCKDDCLIIVTWFGDVYFCGIWYGKNSNTPQKLEF